MLKQLQLEQKLFRFHPDIGAVDLDHGRATDMRPDQRRVTNDLGSVHRPGFVRHRNSIARLQGPLILLRHWLIAFRNFGRTYLLRL